MSAYRLTPQALDDLSDVWVFIARDNLEAADRVEQAVYQACELIATAPLAGSVRGDLTAFPVRFWTVQPYTNYLIVYDPKTSPVQIIRILHGARNLPSILT
jgi:plasmid stabilization system protein ParE